MASSNRDVHQGRRKMYRTVDETHKQYINSATGEYKQELLEKVSCFVCLSDRYVHLFKKRGGHYVRCSNCSHIYLNPMFLDDALQTYYRQLHSVQAEAIENESEFYREIYTQGLQLIQRHMSGGNIFDIGCSSGFFLDIAAEQGWKTYGTELNKSEVAIAKAKGEHIVYENQIENIDFGLLRFDVITMWDVFEHIKDGYSFLSKLRGLLTPKGVIFMQIPNSDALAARILQEKCNMFDGIEHVNLYNLKSFRTLLAKNEGKILELESVISEISVSMNYLNYEDPYMGSGNRTDFFGLISQKDILSNNLG